MKETGDPKTTFLPNTKYVKHVFCPTLLGTLAGSRMVDSYDRQLSMLHSCLQSKAPLEFLR